MPGTPELAKKYPINVISQHPAFRTHSQYYNLPWIQEIEGPAKIFINEEDAAKRKIRDGELVRVFNDRGELVNIKACVSRRVKPGVAEMSSGMWVKLGGSINKLTLRSAGRPPGHHEYRRHHVCLSSAAGRKYGRIFQYID